MLELPPAVTAHHVWEQRGAMRVRDSLWVGSPREPEREDAFTWRCWDLG